MSRPAGSARATAAVAAFVIAAAWITLPDLVDVDVVKLHALVLLGALVAIPTLAFARADAWAGWLRSPGALLPALAALAAVPAAIDAFDHAAVQDRAAGLALALGAGAIGWSAHRARGDGLALGLLVAGAGTAVVVLAQAAEIDRVLALTVSETWRALPPPLTVGLAGNTTRAGGLLALAALAGIARRRGGGGRASFVAVALIVAALVLTQARAAWIATALVAAALSWRVPRRALARLWLPVAAGLVGAVLVAGPDALAARKLPGATVPGDPDDPTTAVRVAVARATFAMAADRPLLGAGLGRFRERFPPYRRAEEAERPGLLGAATEVGHPHDEWLLALAEGGVVALAAMLAFAALTARRGARVLAVPEGSDTSGATAGAVFLGGAVLALAQNAWTSPTTAVPCFAAAGALWATGAGRAGPATGSRVSLVAMPVLVLLAALAVPRLDAHLELRRFLLASLERGVDTETFEFATLAARAGPTDVDVLTIVAHYGGALIEASPIPDGFVFETTQRAREALADVAPHR